MGGTVGPPQLCPQWAGITGPGQCGWLLLGGQHLDRRDPALGHSSRGCHAMFKISQGRVLCACRDRTLGLLFAGKPWIWLGSEGRRESWDLTVLGSGVSDEVS